jgi:hypothetical protein
MKGFPITEVQTASQATAKLESQMWARWLLQTAAIVHEAI